MLREFRCTSINLLSSLLHVADCGVIQFNLYILDFIFNNTLRSDFHRQPMEVSTYFYKIMYYSFHFTFDCIVLFMSCSLCLQLTVNKRFACLLEANKQGLTLKLDPSGKQNRCFYQCLAFHLSATAKADQVIEMVKSFLLANQVVRDVVVSTHFYFYFSPGLKVFRSL